MLGRDEKHKILDLNGRYEPVGGSCEYNDEP
jgi:hypothetical protein